MQCSLDQSYVHSIPPISLEPTPTNQKGTFRRSFVLDRMVHIRSASISDSKLLFPFPRLAPSNATIVPVTGVLFVQISVN